MFVLQHVRHYHEVLNLNSNIDDRQSVVKHLKNKWKTVIQYFHIEAVKNKA